MSPPKGDYQALRKDEWDLGQDENGLENGPILRSTDNKSSWMSRVIIGVLILSNIGTLIMLMRNTADPGLACKQPGQVVDTSRSLDIPFVWYTPFSSDNYTESDPLWENVKSSHGLIAVDSDLAEKQNLPNSTILPHKEGLPPKKVYLLESYHQIHCLRIIRTTLRQTMEGKELTWPIRHTWHCIDTLRQSVQCNADSTALSTFGHGRSGDGQLRRCRNWDTLRDWATANSACYTDKASDSPFGDHYGLCDDGTDGLPLATELAMQG